MPSKDEIVAALNEEARKNWNDPVWRAAKAKEMIETIYLGPTEFSSFLVGLKPTENQLS